MACEILIVEDDLIVAGDIRRTLEKARFKVNDIVASAEEAVVCISTKRPTLVILDIYLAGSLTGIDLAMKLKRQKIAFVYLSANSNEQILEKAKVSEPDGFIVKPFREKDLIVSVQIALYRVSVREQQRLITNRTLELNRPIADPATKSPAKEGMPNFEGIIGNSAPMKNVFQLIQQVAPTNTSVMITGESGTGKEGVAAAIHHLSGRRKGPFVKINCGAIPAHLIESELFGHERGAFTGAIEKKIGKFEKAEGGTILLDEIGEMPPDLQVKLLRVLQEREIERVGGLTPIKVDVRIIAATNKNLEKEIAAGKFRLDLYYRLLVFPIALPPLRNRSTDIELLVSWFIKLFAEKNNKPVTRISSQALQRLLKHSWPGNIRELEHLIERAVLQTQTDCINEVSILNIPGGIQGGEKSEPKTLQEIENDHIILTLERCGNRIAGPGGAAETLDIKPSTLYSKMKKFGISRTFGSKK